MHRILSAFRRTDCKGRLFLFPNLIIRNLGKEVASLFYPKRARARLRKIYFTAATMMDEKLTILTLFCILILPIIIFMKLTSLNLQIDTHNLWGLQSWSQTCLQLLHWRLGMRFLNSIVLWWLISLHFGRP